MEINFKSDYLTENIATYIGNKRKLLQFINHAIEDIQDDLGRTQVSLFDGFSGSGIVARMFKHYASELYVNDLEGYSNTINRCYLANRSEVPDSCDLINYLNQHKLDAQLPGFIELNYAPRDDDDIQPGERVFFTNKNAKIIDNVRRILKPFEKSEPALAVLALAPLLVKASIHNNTSGVFKGFHKKNGIGHFGGAGEHALKRIKGEIVLDTPVFSQHECPVHIFQDDVQVVAGKLPPLDIVYYDPPYNQHPYGSNYFMLNVINEYDDPEIQDGVSGIAAKWNKSVYNKKLVAEQALQSLIESTNAKYVLISYNDEGIIPAERFRTILDQFGSVELRMQTYHTYRGSKNLGKNKFLANGNVRPLQVRELLWILKK